MATIALSGPIPGPRSQALFARRTAAVPQGPFHVAPIGIERAAGAAVTDVDGNVYLDFTGGLGSLAAGHAPRRVVEAVTEQASRFLHTCFHVALYEPYIALAEKLNAITPGRHPKKTLLVSSGAEAVENAVKIARYHTKRPAVLCFEHGFAGRTLLAMSLTSKVMPYKYGFGPYAPEIYRLPYPYLYRSGFDDEERFLDHAITELGTFFTTHVDPRQVACVLMELVLGEGGFVAAPPRYVQALAALCRQHGILFIADEIQTGFGRTGRLFACEHYGLEPDLMTMAKSLGSGLPIAAVTGRAEIMDSPHVGGLGGTYGGNPLGCAAALATISELEELRLVERAAELGAQLRQRLLALQARDERIGEVRGLGAMLALELVEDRQRRRPAKELTTALVRRCWEHGLLLISAGTFGNVIRFLLPLVTTDAQLAEGLDVLERQLAAQ